MGSLKVLVTGATGFIGGYMVPELARSGHEVVAMVRASNEGRLRQTGVQERVADLTDADSLVAATKGMEAVVHLAAYYTFFGKRELYDKITVEGTRSLVKACLSNGVRRFVYCSSTEAIGPVETPPGDESTPLMPTYEYGRSKVAAERIVREAGEQGLEWTIIRPSGIYGPRNLHDVAYWFIEAIAKGSLATGFLVAGGRSLVQFVSVRDAVKAFALALEKPEVSKGQTYVISDSHAVSYRDLYAMTARLCGRKPPTRSIPRAVAKAMIAPIEGFNVIAGRQSFMWHLSTVDAVTSDRSFSSAKAARELGYMPTVELEDGLRETIEWYRANGYI